MGSGALSLISQLLVVKIEQNIISFKNLCSILKDYKKIFSSFYHFEVDFGGL